MRHLSKVVFTVSMILTGIIPLGAQTAFVTGAGYSKPAAIPVAPGQIATFYVGGLAQTSTTLQKMMAVLIVGGVQQTLEVVSSEPVDALTVAVTVQMPFSLVPGGVSTSGTLLPVSIQFGESDSSSNKPLRRKRMHGTGRFDGGAYCAAHYQHVR